MTTPTGPSQDPSPSPSDILLVILSIVLLLAAGFVLGGLAAHPF